MYTKIKTYRIFKIDDKLMRKLFEFKASNQDNLHPTMKYTVYWSLKPLSGFPTSQM